MIPAKPAHRVLSWIGMCSVYLTSFAMMYVWTIMPRHLEALAWTGTWIGILYGVRKVVESLSMWMWATVADRSGQIIKWLRIQYALGILCLAPLIWIETPWVVALCIICFGALQGGSLPLLDTLSIQRVGATKFGKVRLWGSAGFLSLALTGGLIGLFGSYDILAKAVPLLLTFFAILAAIGTFALNQDGVTNTPPKQAVKLSTTLSLLRKKPIAILLGLACLHWAAQSPFNMFIVTLFEYKKMPAWTPGISVALGVACELVVMSQANRILERVTPKKLMCLAIALGSFRWLLTGWSTTLWVVVSIQVLHGLSFGLFFATAVATLHKQVEPHQQAQAQACLYLIMFGLGSLIGNMASGIGMEHLGITNIFIGAGLLDLALCLALLTTFFKKSSNSFSI